MSAAEFAQGPLDPIGTALREMLDAQREYCETLEACVTQVRADEETRNKHRPPGYLLGVRVSTVAPYGFDMTCHFEYVEAEPAIHYGDYPHPGSPGYCSLGACYVGGHHGVGAVDIHEMLDCQQVEMIEQLLLEEMEC